VAAEVVLVMDLPLATAAGLTALAGQIYSNALLRSRRRVPLRNGLLAR
jgi:hypothetical protein